MILGFDEKGTHLFQCDPSGNYHDYYAMAIGARSQSAKTYLEQNYLSFENASREELIIHGLKALKDTLQQDAKLTELNTSIAIVGENCRFTILENDEIKQFLDQIPSDKPRAEMEIS